MSKVEDFANWKEENNALLNASYGEGQEIVDLVKGWPYDRDDGETLYATKLADNKKPGAWESQVGGKHYKELSIQPSEYCQRNKLLHLESNAIKYISRHRLRNGKEDVLKAIHCLELLLELEYRGK